MATDHAEFNALLERARAGDAAARGELLARYGQKVRQAVHGRLPEALRKEFDSLDFAHDVWASFLAMPRERLVFDGPAALAAFLARIAHFKIAETIRRRYSIRGRGLTEALPLPQEARDDSRTPRDPSGSPSQLMAAAEQWDEMVRGLPDGHRAVMERLRDGWSHQEIADALGLSTRTVERVVRRAKTQCGL